MTDEQEVRFKTLRSLLFIPALNERFVSAAHTRRADGIILDLEDSITLERKAEARESLAKATKTIRGHGLPVVARINNRPELIKDDLRAAVLARVDAIMIPKAETVGILSQVDEWL